MYSPSRHTGAAAYILSREAARLVLEVEDQGTGFDAESVQKNGSHGGLSGMRERADHVEPHRAVQFNR